MLTGFLGSGKSTLLNTLLRAGALPPTAIIVNEFGEVAIDHALIEGVVDGVMLLGAGCVCCAVRSDLEGALRDLHLKRVRGLIPEYAAVILETTGLADPGPVLQTLTSRPVREMRYRLGPVVTTFDAEHGEATLAVHHEAARQVAVADHVIITKTDLVADERAAVAAIRNLNPAARITLGAADSADAFTGALAAQLPQDRRFDGTSTSHARPGIAAYGRVIAGKLNWDVTDRLIRSFLSDHGDQVLRLKALVDLQDVEQPVALHGVHHMLYPPEPVVSNGPAGQGSRVTIIGDQLPAGAATDLLDALEAAAG